MCRHRRVRCDAVLCCCCCCCGRLCACVHVWSSVCVWKLWNWHSIDDGDDDDVWVYDWRTCVRVVANRGREPPARIRFSCCMLHGRWGGRRPKVPLRPPGAAMAVATAAAATTMPASQLGEAITTDKKMTEICAFNWFLGEAGEIRLGWERADDSQADCECARICWHRSHWTQMCVNMVDRCWEMCVWSGVEMNRGIGEGARGWTLGKDTGWDWVGVRSNCTCTGRMCIGYIFWMLIYNVKNRYVDREYRNV